MQHLVHGLSKPEGMTKALLRPIAQQLPSTTGLDVMITRHERDVRVFRRRKAAGHQQAASAFRTSGASPYEKNPLAALQLPGPAPSRQTRRLKQGAPVRTLPAVRADSVRGLNTRAGSVCTAPGLAGHYSSMSGDIPASSMPSHSQSQHSSRPRPPLARSIGPSAAFAAALKWALQDDCSGEQRSARLTAFVAKQICRNWALTADEVRLFVQQMQMAPTAIQVLARMA